MDITTVLPNPMLKFIQDDGITKLKLSKVALAELVGAQINLM